MTSYIDMSLDDIIKKKKRSSPRKSVKPKVPNPLQSKTIDARNKIVSKKRTQIRDAREKLIDIAQQKDARLRLEELRAKKGNFTGPNVHKAINNRKTLEPFTNKRDRVFADPSRQVVSKPFENRTTNAERRHNNNNIFMEERSLAPKAYLKSPIKPIMRTIDNDLEIIDDPMGEEYIPAAMALDSRKASLQLKITTHANNNYQRTAIREREKSPPHPPSILKKRPIAALRLDKKKTDIEKPTLDFRVIVSNLCTTVTGGDIKELFGDVGGMVESRLVRPGTAEVIYKTVEDAQRAVELYHNRQLDGQPMNCLLVTPRTTNNLVKSGSKATFVSSNSNVEPDISTFHKVLFSHF
ncbi:unnamed protein product [Leptosia nina]|uniref:RRM domain-containing protein n=1 Tax=Leptosia nina TaxID=320188 RepID=A0AAV1J8B0_9NEOP